MYLVTGEQTEGVFVYGSTSGSTSHDYVGILRLFNRFGLL